MTQEERPTWPAVRKGWRRKCPNCGSGPMLRGYLKVRDTCPVCREELHHHRADDGPAYLTILIVGHLMAPLLHIVFVNFRPDPLVLFTIFAVGCVALDALSSAQTERGDRGLPMVTVHARVCAFRDLTLFQMAEGSMNDIRQS